MTPRRRFDPGDRVRYLNFEATVFEILGHRVQIHVPGLQRTLTVRAADLELAYPSTEADAADPELDDDVDVVLPVGRVIVPPPVPVRTAAPAPLEPPRFVLTSPSPGLFGGPMPAVGLHGPGESTVRRVEDLVEGGGSPSERPRSVRRSPAPTEGGGTLQALEALRFGLVPASRIRSLTLGYSRLRDWVVDHLPSAHGHRMVVSRVRGPFGTGKSHTLAVVRHLAREAGYVTVRADVDGKMVSLSDPEKLLRALFSRIQGSGLPALNPLLHLHREAIEGHRPSAVAAGLQGFLRVRCNVRAVERIDGYGAVEENSAVLESILACTGEYTATEANRVIRKDIPSSALEADLQPLVGHRVAGRPIDFVGALSGTAKLAAMAGFEGMVVTIDEFEVEQQLDRQHRARLIALLKTLEEYLHGRTNFLPAPLAVVIATVGEEGSQGESSVANLAGKTPGADYQLRSLKLEELRGLAEDIFGVYAEAYGLSLDFDPSWAIEAEQEFLPHERQQPQFTRAYIRQFMRVLDARLGPGGRA